jgi:6-phosphogluconolactonase
LTDFDIGHKLSGNIRKEPFMKRPRGGSFLAMSIVLLALAGVSTGCGSLAGSGSDSGGAASKFVFVSNTDNDSISAFGVGSDGALTLVRTVALAPDSAPMNIVLHPNGRFLYVVNSSVKFGAYFNLDNASIGAYALGDNGVITEIAGSPFSLPTGGTGVTEGVFVTMAVTPDGKFLYVGDIYNWQVLVFGIGQTTGALTLNFQVPLEDAEDSTGIEPWSLAVHPSGVFLFVGFYNSSDNTIPGGVSTFVIDQEDGDLSTDNVIGLYSDSTAGGAYVSLAVTPDGHHLYAAGVDRRAEFTINAANGALTLLVNPPADTSADQPRSLAVTPDGRYLYSANSLSGTLGALKIGSDGKTVDSVPGQPFKLFDVSSNLDLVNPTSVTVTGDGKYLYVANSSVSFGNNVTAYAIVAATGALEHIDTYLVELGPMFLIALP